MATNKSTIQSIAQSKCPHCREGDIFLQSNPYKLKEMTDMPDECKVCGQDFKIEDGFFLGATYVSYAITIAISVGILFFGFFLFGLTFLQTLPLMLTVLVALTPVIVRYSRVLWMYMFIS
jgi:uncharacterized protein (DUF983 family)